MHTHTKNTHTCAYVIKGNELLIREYAPERSPALINFVPASDKKTTGNMVNLVSMETSSNQLNEAILSLLPRYLDLLQIFRVRKEECLFCSLLNICFLCEQKKKTNYYVLIVLP